MLITSLLLLTSGLASAATVKDYGATGNGSSDDTRAIQVAIDSTPLGGTLSFPPGTYLVTSRLLFRSSRTYQGQPGAVLHPSGQDFVGWTDFNTTNNVTFDSLTFDGGGLMIAGNSVAANNVHITHCTFQNINNSSDNWPAHNGIFIASGMTGGSTIAYNRFANIYVPGSMEDTQHDEDITSGGIHMYDIMQTSITDNTFDMVYQGISGQFNGVGPFTGVLIARNNFNQVHRMGIETQGANTQGLTVDSNYMNNFHNPYYMTFGMSIALDGGHQTYITNNYISASPAPYTSTSQGVRYGLGIELSGYNTTATGNVIAHTWYGYITIGQAPYVTVQNNIICNAATGANVTFESGTQPGPVVTPNSVQATCPASPQSDTTIPSVSLTSPSDGAAVTGTVTLAANASDNVAVTNVGFMVDGILQGSSTSAPYSVQLNTATLTNAAHTVTAVASDAAGNKATSGSVTINVNNANASAAPSSPIPSAGLSMWLRADQGITLNGSSVSRWADQSGAGVDAVQPNASSQPAFVAPNAVRFNGTSSYLGFNLPINGLTGMSIFMVASNSTSQQGGAVLANSSALYWGETAYWGVTYLSPFQTNVAFRFGTTQTGNLPDYVRPASVGTASTISTVIKNGSSEALYVNGQQALNATGKLTTIAASTNSAYVGRGDNTVSGGGTYFAGDISEIIVYNRALSDLERQTVEAYLSARNR